MYRKIIVASLVWFSILGVGPAWAQAAPDTAKAPPPAVSAPPTTPAPATPAPVQPSLVYYEKARVVVDGQAEAHGSLAMTFTPLGGNGKSFTVNVLLKAKKKDVARDIHKELSIAAGSAYKVKLDGDTIHISKTDKKTTPNFAMGVDKLAVSGVSVRVEKD